MEINKKVLSMVIAGWMVLWGTLASAEMGGQVFYRFGSASLRDDRGGEAFTDTLGLGGKNNGKGSYAIGAGLDIPLASLFGNTLLGEVMVEYAKFSDKEVLQMPSVVVNDVLNCGNEELTDGTCPSGSTSKVVVSSLAVVIAPKYRFEVGNFRPWIIPIGLAFLVNSPPSNDATYLDFGPHFGAGVEYRLIDLLSVGIDYRLNLGSGQSRTKTDYSTFGGYVGINF